MARIISFMICDGINNAVPAPGVAVPQLSSPCCALRPEFIPGNFTFGIAIGVAGVDPAKQNSIRFSIKNPKGETVQESGQMMLPMAEDDAALPPEYRGFMICFEVRNLVVAEKGIFTIQLFVNEEEAGTQEIPVFPRHES